MTARQWDARDRWLVAALVAMKLIVSCVIWRFGFSHVSDDDFARIVIAQMFAKSPSLDPSTTSWLPFPFWVAGTVFMAAGRSLFIVKVLSLLQGAVAWAVLFVALRREHLAAWSAWICSAIAMCLPWNVWLGATIVPEGYVGPLLAAAMIAGSKPNALSAGLLLICTLSRYESWPVAVALAGYWLLLALSGRSIKWALLALVAIAGVIAWMAWNRTAHGDALHFFARVSRYRQNLQLPTQVLAERIAVYPNAIVLVMGPFAAIALGALPAVVLRQTRMLWRLPLVLSVVELGALIFGELKDGAPTHHPERAVLAIVVVLFAAGTSGWVTLFTNFARQRSAREMFFIGGAAALSVYGLVWGIRESGAFPGRSESDVRQTQLMRGAALLPTVRYRVTPCAYEHFALIAAFGRPEQVEIVVPSVRTEPMRECPHVKVIDGSK